MEAAFCLEPSDEQRRIRDWAHDFAERRIRPAAAEWDEREEYPWPILQEAAELGIYSSDLLYSSIEDPTGLLMPLFTEELFWGDAGIGLALVGSQLAATAILANGTLEQAKVWVERCYGAAHDPKLAAFCSSEPDAGSDVGSVRTSARYDEATDEWVLNGEKAWVTNGGIASVYVVVATVDSALGAKGHAAFVVPSETRGISAGPKYLKHGLRASHTAPVSLQDCRVPGANLLGGRESLDERVARAREGRRDGSSNAAMRTFERARPSVGAQAIGIARAAYEFALHYAGERHQFGRPIIDNQAIAFALADMRTDIDAARLLVWRASWMAATDRRPTSGEGSMAKLRASEVAVSATDTAVQILGGYGFTREFPVERWRRDAKIYTIFEGTSEIQRLIISRAISGRRIK